jgi:hypothetical protein
MKTGVCEKINVGIKSAASAAPVMILVFMIV